LRCRSSGPWHLKHRSDRRGLTWKLKSTRSGTPAMGGAAAGPHAVFIVTIATQSALPRRAAVHRDDVATVPALCAGAGRPARPEYWVRPGRNLSRDGCQRSVFATRRLSSRLGLVML